MKNKTAKKEKYYEFNPERRRLAKIYSRQKLIMNIGNNLILPVLTILILFFTGSLQKLASWSISSWGNIFGVLLFLLILTAVQQIIDFPLTIYGGFFYEHKYKLSRQTLKEWFVDYGKSFILGIIMSLPLGLAIAFLALNLKLWWLYASILGIVFSIFVNFIYPIWIVPFFYKMYPYTDRKELKNILNIIKRCGAENIKKIKIIKESEKSTKVNAFFAGLGRTKMIVLYDNLINFCTKTEVRSVIAHELGHYLHKDMIKSTIVDAIQTIITLFFADAIIRRTLLSSASAAGIPLYLIPMISVFTAAIGFFLMPIAMTYSRKLEVAADRFAMEQVPDYKAQISLEKRLADLDLGEYKSHPLIEFWFHSHPSTQKRLANIKKHLMH